MSYILINRNDIVVDILKNIRYIQLISSTGNIIACEKEKGIGVIGSDNDTHYTLIKSDTLNSPNAVSVLEFDGDLSNIIPNKTVFDSKNRTFKPRYTLNEYQLIKQEENKKAFTNYLIKHPLLWVDGKFYGVTEQDQAEINLKINQYQNAENMGLETPSLEWHAQHEENASWTMENLVSLSLRISAYVYPIYHKMQEYKTQIFNASSFEEVDAVNCTFYEE